MDTTAFVKTATLDQLKTLFNATVTEARTQTKDARALREEIERRDPSLRGQSRLQLGDAERALYTARTFANAPLDLPASDNPYRNGTLGTAS